MKSESLVSEHERRTGVSIIIPTRNGASRLKQLFPVLQNQTVPPDEILIIDSASSDDTLDIARDFGAGIISIPLNEFDHGGTRTMAARQAAGDILVFMTQDAVPADSRALEHLVRALDDPRVAAAYGRQLPNEEATVFAEHLRLFNYPKHSHVRCWDDRIEYGFKTTFISNSFAAYRRQPLEEQGFFPDKLLFGEDACTLAKLLEHGFCVAYVCEARVYHSHNYSVAQDFKRYFDIGVFHADRRDLVQKFGTPLGEGRRYVLSELSLLIKRKKYWRIPESCARNLVKFLAYNLGKHYIVVPRRLASLCSMNGGWWS